MMMMMMVMVMMVMVMVMMVMVMVMVMMVMVMGKDDDIDVDIDVCPPAAVTSPRRVYLYPNTDDTRRPSFPFLGPSPSVRSSFSPGYRFRFRFRSMVGNPSLPSPWETFPRGNGGG